MTVLEDIPEVDGGASSDNHLLQASVETGSDENNTDESSVQNKDEIKNASTNGGEREILISVAELREHDESEKLKDKVTESSEQIIVDNQALDLNASKLIASDVKDMNSAAGYGVNIIAHKLEFKDSKYYFEMANKYTAHYRKGYTRDDIHTVLDRFKVMIATDVRFQGLVERLIVMLDSIKLQVYGKNVNVIEITCMRLIELFEAFNKSSSIDFLLTIQHIIDTLEDSNLEHETHVTGIDLKSVDSEVQRKILDSSAVKEITKPDWTKIPISFCKLPIDESFRLNITEKWEEEVSIKKNRKTRKIKEKREEKAGTSEIYKIEQPQCVTDTMTATSKSIESESCTSPGHDVRLLASVENYSAPAESDASDLQYTVEIMNASPIEVECESEIPLTECNEEVIVEVTNAITWTECNEEEVIVEVTNAITWTECNEEVIVEIMNASQIEVEYETAIPWPESSEQLIVRNEILDLIISEDDDILLLASVENHSAPAESDPSDLQYAVEITNASLIEVECEIVMPSPESSEQLIVHNETLDLMTSNNIASDEKDLNSTADYRVNFNVPNPKQNDSQCAEIEKMFKTYFNTGYTIDHVVLMIARLKVVLLTVVRFNGIREELMTELDSFKAKLLDDDSYTIEVAFLHFLELVNVYFGESVDVILKIIDKSKSLDFDPEKLQHAHVDGFQEIDNVDWKSVDSEVEEEVLIGPQKEEVLIDNVYLKSVDREVQEEILESEDCTSSDHSILLQASVETGSRKSSSQYSEKIKITPPNEAECEISVPGLSQHDESMWLQRFQEIQNAVRNEVECEYTILSLELSQENDKSDTKDKSDESDKSSVQYSEKLKNASPITDESEIQISVTELSQHDDGDKSSFECSEKLKNASPITDESEIQISVTELSQHDDSDESSFECSEKLKNVSELSQHFNLSDVNLLKWEAIKSAAPDHQEDEFIRHFLGSGLDRLEDIPTTALYFLQSEPLELSSKHTGSNNLQQSNESSEDIVDGFKTSSEADQNAVPFNAAKKESVDSDVSYDEEPSKVDDLDVGFYDETINNAHLTQNTDVIEINNISVKRRLSKTNEPLSLERNGVAPCSGPSGFLIQSVEADIPFSPSPLFAKITYNEHLLSKPEFDEDNCRDQKSSSSFIERKDLSKNDQLLLTNLSKLVQTCREECDRLAGGQKPRQSSYTSVKKSNKKTSLVYINNESVSDKSQVSYGTEKDPSAVDEKLQSGKTHRDSAMEHAEEAMYRRGSVASDCCHSYYDRSWVNVNPADQCNDHEEYYKMNDYWYPTMRPRDNKIKERLAAQLAKKRDSKAQEQNEAANKVVPLQITERKSIDELLSFINGDSKTFKPSGGASSTKACKSSRKTNVPEMTHDEPTVQTKAGKKKSKKEKNIIANDNTDAKIQPDKTMESNIRSVASSDAGKREEKCRDTTIQDPLSSLKISDSQLSCDIPEEVEKSQKEGVIEINVQQSEELDEKLKSIPFEANYLEITTNTEYPNNTEMKKLKKPSNMLKIILTHPQVEADMKTKVEYTEAKPADKSKCELNDNLIKLEEPLQLDLESESLESDPAMMKGEIVKSNETKKAETLSNNLEKKVKKTKKEKKQEKKSVESKRVQNLVAKPMGCEVLIEANQRIRCEDHLDENVETLEENKVVKSNLTTVVTKSVETKLVKNGKKKPEDKSFKQKPAAKKETPIGFTVSLQMERNSKTNVVEKLSTKRVDTKQAEKLNNNTDVVCIKAKPLEILENNFDEEEYTNAAKSKIVHNELNVKSEDGNEQSHLESSEIPTNIAELVKVEMWHPEELKKNEGIALSSTSLVEKFNGTLSESSTIETIKREKIIDPMYLDEFINENSGLEKRADDSFKVVTNKNVRKQTSRAINGNDPSNVPLCPTSKEMKSMDLSNVPLCPTSKKMKRKDLSNVSQLPIPCPSQPVEKLNQVSRVSKLSSKPSVEVLEAITNALLLYGPTQRQERFKGRQSEEAQRPSVIALEAATSVESLTSGIILQSGIKTITETSDTVCEDSKLTTVSEEVHEGQSSKPLYVPSNSLTCRPPAMIYNSSTSVIRDLDNGDRGLPLVIGLVAEKSSDNLLESRHGVRSDVTTMNVNPLVIGDSEIPARPTCFNQNSAVPIAVLPCCIPKITEVTPEEVLRSYNHHNYQQSFPVQSHQQLSYPGGCAQYVAVEAGHQFHGTGTPSFPNNNNTDFGWQPSLVNAYQGFNYPNGGMVQLFDEGVVQPFNGGMVQPFNGGMAQPFNGGIVLPFNGSMVPPFNGSMVPPFNGGMLPPSIVSTYQPSGTISVNTMRAPPTMMFPGVSGPSFPVGAPQGFNNFVEDASPDPMQVHQGFIYRDGIRISVPAQTYQIVDVPCGGASSYPAQEHQVFNYPSGDIPLYQPQKHQGFTYPSAVIPTFPAEQHQILNYPSEGISPYPAQDFQGCHFPSGRILSDPVEKLPRVENFLSGGKGKALSNFHYSIRHHPVDEGQSSNCPSGDTADHPLKRFGIIDYPPSGDTLPDSVKELESCNSPGYSRATVGSMSHPSNRGFDNPKFYDPAIVRWQLATIQDNAPLTEHEKARASAPIKKLNEKNTEGHNFDAIHTLDIMTRQDMSSKTRVRVSILLDPAERSETPRVSDDVRISGLQPRTKHSEYTSFDALDKAEHFRRSRRFDRGQRSAVLHRRPVADDQGATSTGTFYEDPRNLKSTSYSRSQSTRFEETDQALGRNDDELYAEKEAIQTGTKTDNLSIQSDEIEGDVSSSMRGLIEAPKKSGFDMEAAVKYVSEAFEEDRADAQVIVVEENFKQ